MLVKPISAPPATTAPVCDSLPLLAVSLLSYGEVQVALNASDMPTNARRDTTREQITAWAAQGIERLGGVARVRALFREAADLDRFRARAWMWVELADESPNAVIVDMSDPASPLRIDPLAELLDADRAYKRFWRNDARNQRCVDFAYTLLHPF